MIDRGLLLSVALIVATVWLVARRWPPRLQREESVLSASFNPITAGVVAGRLVAVAVDDPAALTHIRDLLVIRGGMEFWPGVAAAVAACALGVRRSRSQIPVTAELADLAPYALGAYAVYEATCLVRDGCFGPVSVLGLRPGGLGPTEVPIGLFVAAAVVALAVWVRRVGRTDLVLAIIVGVLGLAAIRSVAAIWLPKIGESASRPQMESLAIAVASLAVLAYRLRTRHRTTEQEPGAGRDA
ncbi:MAG TPA: prolipoprotein diacylglyceryl transferase family protein [Acidimicrobiales bacterium]|nr:prolipoprotein diacylglyceryl transferase family protein [Acidimicrobiales bacterium]